MFIIWIKIDETLPKIELEGEYSTKKEAKRAAQQIINDIKVEIINTSQKRDAIKSLATAKAIR